METIYGESPEIYKEEGYESNGGIALFSVRNGGETITSSDQGGRTGSWRENFVDYYQE